MVAVYEAFTAPDFAELVERYGGRIVQPVAGQIVQTATAQLPVPGKVQSATGQIVPSVTAQNRADAASIFMLTTFDRYLGLGAPPPESSSGANGTTVRKGARTEASSTREIRP